MKEVVVLKPKNSSLSGQLVSLYLALKDQGERKKLNFNLSKIDWAYPFLILPLSAYINSTKSSYTAAGSVKSYLDAVKFPEGIDSVFSFQKEIQSKKNYIPISILRKEKNPDRERLESLFSNLILKVVGSVPGTRSAILYPISELVTNIFEHSLQNKGYLFGQFYPNKDYLDICIVDRGRGLAETYKEEGDLTLTDSEAILRSMKGGSTKASKERGYGVRTSRNVVCNAMDGEFVFLSGSAALVSSGRSEKLFTLPGFYWQGVIIAYRIPRPTGPVDIYKNGYLE
ncbi:MAG: hypothetical protein P4L62_03505 [Candidatus Pacebacteria bacterium]|nr:hypothetical protein [Candidatus Paceibacterota bacterium]